MAGLNPNIRLSADPGEIEVEHVEDDLPEDVPEITQDGAILTIEHGDGSISLSLDGKPLADAEPEKGNDKWFRNLCDELGESDLNGIADDLLEGVREDLASRQDWIEDRAQGIKLLGLRIEVPGIGGGSDGAPVEGMSKVRHPLLQEAVLRFQANARSEMLPTDGPVKIRDDGNNATVQKDELATAFEKDMNHYLTSTATEYYPDTDRMFLLLGFGGTTFKKVYNCPLRNRPVSLTVDADDLIVNSEATDLAGAARVTHRVMMKPSTIRRMQLLDIYDDVDLGDAQQASLDSVQEEKKAQQGVTVSSSRPEDRNREIYEVYCELDLPGFEHKMRGKETGLEIPYRVTIDVSSRKVLSIVRNYNEDTKDMPEARVTFVKYTFVPGFGFYDIGLLNILGNTTNAVTAGWRELLDAGMYANFPGFLMSDTGGRQNTNVFRIPPGGSAQVKTNGMPIKDAIMPLPYKDPSPALMGLITSMAETGMRVGGTSELQVGEGRADAPVGTTLAMIEQATKVLNSVHKRMHQAQAQEFSLIVECFRENPTAFWQRNKKPTLPWDQAMFLKALDQVDLVPQADPNTSSHAQRVMKIMALKQLQVANPGLYDERAVDEAALRAIGWNNPEQFMKPKHAAQSPPPEVLKGIEEIKIAHQEADAKTMTAQAAMARAQMPQQQGAAPEPGLGQAELQIKQTDQQLKAMQLKNQMERDKINDENRDLALEADREMERERVRIEEMKFQSTQSHERAMHEDDHRAALMKLAAQVQQARVAKKNG